MIVTFVSSFGNKNNKKANTPKNWKCNRNNQIDQSRWRSQNKGSGNPGQRYTDEHSQGKVAFKVPNEFIQDVVVSCWTVIEGPSKGQVKCHFQEWSKDHHNSTAGRGGNGTPYQSVHGNAVSWCQFGPGQIGEKTSTNGRNLNEETNEKSQNEATVLELGHHGRVQFYHSNGRHFAVAVVAVAVAVSFAGCSAAMFMNRGHERFCHLCILARHGYGCCWIFSKYCCIVVDCTSIMYYTLWTILNLKIVEREKKNVCLCQTAGPASGWIERWSCRTVVATLL